MATLAEMTDAGCIGPFPNGAVGQVLTIDASGNPVWAAAAADDQAAVEVPITTIAGIPAAITTQGALEAIVAPVAAAACEAPITLHGLDIAGVLRSFNALFPMSTPNAGAALPIADFSYSGGNVSAQNGLAFHESNDIIPVVQGLTPCGVDVQWVHRPIGARYVENATEIVYNTPYQRVVVDYPTKEWDDVDSVTPGAGWLWTCKIAGRYHFTASVSTVYRPALSPTTGDSATTTGTIYERIWAWKNGGFYKLISIPHPSQETSVGDTMTIEISADMECAVGDTLQIMYSSTGEAAHYYFANDFQIHKI